MRMTGSCLAKGLLWWAAGAGKPIEVASPARSIAAPGGTTTRETAHLDRRCLGDLDLDLPEPRLMAEPQHIGWRVLDETVGELDPVVGIVGGPATSDGDADLDRPVRRAAHRLRKAARLLYNLRESKLERGARTR